MANRIGFQATGFAASIDSQPRGDRRAGEPELSGSASRCASFKKSIHVASADAQSVYVAPGGVYVGGGPVYLIPAPNNGAPPYVAPTYGYAPGSPYGTSYAAPYGIYSSSYAIAHERLKSGYAAP